MDEGDQIQPDHIVLWRILSNLKTVIKRFGQIVKNNVNCANSSAASSELIET